VLTVAVAVPVAATAETGVMGEESDDAMLDGWYPRIKLRSSESWIPSARNISSMPVCCRTSRVILRNFRAH
jgi:hypothetical protein